MSIDDESPALFDAGPPASLQLTAADVMEKLDMPDRDTPRRYERLLLEIANGRCPRPISELVVTGETATGKRIWSQHPRDWRWRSGAVEKAAADLLAAKVRTPL